MQLLRNSFLARLVGQPLVSDLPTILSIASQPALTSSIITVSLHRAVLAP
jgi:hypothetical protein